MGALTVRVTRVYHAMKRYEQGDDFVQGIEDAVGVRLRTG